MSEDVTMRLKQLNAERTMASELIAAVGQFLVKAENANCPKLKAKCDELITTGLAMISHHTERITSIRAQLPDEKQTEAERIAARARVTRGRK